MTRFKNFFSLFLPVLMLMAILAGNTQAALLDFGPIVPEVVGSQSPNIGHGFPAWFRDSNRVPLQLCLEEVPGCLFAAADFPNPAQPASFPANLPDELFYYSATATIGPHLLFAGVEMNFFNNGPGDYEQVGFSRVRIRIDTTVAGNYTVTTPWKQYFFTVDQATIDANGGTRVINATEDIGLRADGDFAGVLLGNIGPYVYSQGAPFVTANGSFLGNGAPLPVQGSTFTDPVTGQPANIFRIEGPPGFTTVSTNQFAITGKLYLDPIPTPLTVDKLTYARDAAGVQVNAFATTQPLSNQNVGGTAIPGRFALTNAPSALRVSGTGIPTQGMTTNNPADGKFFSTTGVFAFQGNLPAQATVTNTADTPDTVKTMPLVDEVKITNATYNPLTNTLTIAAQSLDIIANQTLNAYMPGMENTLGTLSNGQLSVTFPVNDNSGALPKTFSIPTNTITVKSALGGEATAPVITFSPLQSPPTIAPLQITPTAGSVVSSTPVYTFTPIPEATGYQIFLFNVTTQTGSPGVVFTPAQANCSSNIGICTITQTPALVPGSSYAWYVRAQNTAGPGPWSPFSPITAVTTPTAPTQISPSGSGLTTTPVYTFSSVANATGYQIFLWNATTQSGGPGTVFTPAQANCPLNSGICTITQTPALDPGTSYAWYVRAQNSAGTGPWSPFLNITTGTPPIAPTQISPSGSGISSTPVYTFNAIAGATGYQIFLWNATTQSGGPSAVFTPTQANCPQGTGQCTITQTPALTAGTYAWYVREQNGLGIGPWSPFLSITIP